MLHSEILSQEQNELLPFLSQFKKEFYLVGGTAIALHIGHRYSIDFDFFNFKKFSNKKILKAFVENKVSHSIIHSEGDQIHLNSNRVKITYFEFPYKIKAEIDFNNQSRIPDLLTLAAMKAFALGRRAKWKDYVDLYFILKSHHSLDEISNAATENFGNEFLKKQFIAQLGYFNDVDYREEVVYCISNPPSDEEIKEFLVDKSIEL